MVRQSVIDYVRSMLQKGYSASAIKDAMLKYGYTGKDVDDALNAVYHPTIRHEIHLSHTALFAVVIVCVSALIAGLYFYSTPKIPAKLLDLNLEPVKTNAEAGESISFLKELSNLGSSKRYDVVVTHEIIDLKTNKMIAQKTETIAIETRSSSQTKISVPAETKPGDYILRAIAEYDGRKAVATLPIRISPAAKKETCFDGIKNNEEGDVDCGGSCKPCEKQVLECNDNNKCTSDMTENNECVNRPIAPCCGNGICEGQETESCAEDCQNKQEEADELPPTGTIGIIKELAKTNPGKAMEQCSQIDISNLKDTCIGEIAEVRRDRSYCEKISDSGIKDICYSSVAKSANDNKICEEISAEARKDTCYMTFVLDSKDYSVCGKITNKYSRQSCESLRQLSELSR